MKQNQYRSVLFNQNRFQIVIGHTGNALPETPEPERKFVIGAAANGQEVRRPVPRNRAAVGAAAGGRVSRPATSSRSQTTVIGAAASRASRPSTSSRQRASPARSNSNNSSRGSGIVIGLRHNNRKRRSIVF